MKDSDLDVDYDTSTPKRCPGAGAENPPNVYDPSLAEDAGKYVLSINFGAPAADDAPSVVYGYKVTIQYLNPNSEEFEVVPEWSSKLLRTYGLTPLPSGLSLGDGVYSLDTGYALEAGSQYQVDINTFNMDGRQSPAASQTITVGALRGTALLRRWCRGGAGGKH